MYPRATLTAKLAILALLLGAAGLAPWVGAREQWQVNHPDGAPPSAPVGAGQGKHFGMVPQFQPDFWKGQLSNRVPSGTVLSGILDTDLHSARSKPGDTFDIILQDGFVANGRAVIPPHSKIVGHVVDAVPAASLRHGRAGRLQVSLQTLVMPDGRTVPFHGMIDANPNHAPEDEPAQRSLGKSMKDYGQSVSAFAGSFTSGLGFMINKRHRGLDFELDRGEVLPIRLSRSLEMPADAGSALGGMPGGGLSAPPGTFVPGLNPQAPPAPIRSLVPGLVGPDPDAPPAQAGPGGQRMPVPASFAPADDPNALFNQPIRPRPLSDIPDSF